MKELVYTEDPSRLYYCEETNSLCTESELITLLVNDGTFPDRKEALRNLRTFWRNGNYIEVEDS